MPTDLTLKAMNLLHRSIIRASGGHRGWKAAGMPVLMLTTSGRKTGQPHRVMLTSPLREGNALVIVASRGGDDRNPSWFLNIVNNPAVDVVLAALPSQRMRARVASDEERQRLWPQVTRIHRGYANYQAKTKREIPLVLLSSDLAE